MVKWSSRNEGFEDKKRRGRLIVLNKAAKIVLNKVRYKRDNSIIVSKPSLESRDGNKTSVIVLPNTISSSQICKEVQKRY